MYGLDLEFLKVSIYNFDHDHGNKLKKKKFLFEKSELLKIFSQAVHLPVSRCLWFPRSFSHRP